MRAGRGESFFRVDSGSRRKMFGVCFAFGFVDTSYRFAGKESCCSLRWETRPSQRLSCFWWVAATQDPLYRLAALFRAEKSLPPALTLLASASAGTAASAGASDSRSQQDDPLWRVTGCNVPSGPGKAPAPDAAATPTRLCGLGSGDISRCRRETR